MHGKKLSWEDNTHTHTNTQRQRDTFYICIIRSAGVTPL